jgi:hypothetical protein
MPLVFGRVTAPKSLLFSEFALLVIGRSLLMSAHGWLIQTESLLMVRFLISFTVAGDM